MTDEQCIALIATMLITSHARSEEANAAAQGSEYTYCSYPWPEAIEEARSVLLEDVPKALKPEGD